jgi:hypothetical protein
MAEHAVVNAVAGPVELMLSICPALDALGSGPKRRLPDYRSRPSSPPPSCWAERAAVRPASSGNSVLRVVQPCAVWTWLWGQTSHSSHLLVDRQSIDMFAASVRAGQEPVERIAVANNA